MFSLSLVRLVEQDRFDFGERQDVPHWFESHFLRVLCFFYVILLWCGKRVWAGKDGSSGFEARQLLRHIHRTKGIFGRVRVLMIKHYFKHFPLQRGVCVFKGSNGCELSWW